MVELRRPREWPIPSWLQTAWTLARRTVADAIQDRLPGLAAEVAFFAVFALPPFLLAAFASLGYIGRLVGPEVAEQASDRVLAVVGTFLTRESMSFVEPTVRRLFEQGRADITIIGLVVALWAASRVSRVFITALEIAHDREERLSLWKSRLLAFTLTVAAVASSGVILPLMVLGPEAAVALASRFGLAQAFELAWRLAYWPVVAVLGILILATVYHISPPYGSDWRRELPGAVLAFVLWVLGSAGLRAYARFVLESNTTYGPLAAPLVALLWIYVTAFALLLGGELNAQIERFWPTRRDPGYPGVLPAEGSG